MNFGDMHFTGGQQSFGGTNTNYQTNNYAAPAEQVTALLQAIKDQHPDPAYAGRQVRDIEGDLAEGTPQAKVRVLTRLRALADSAGSVRTVAEAATAVGALISAL